MELRADYNVNEPNTNAHGVWRIWGHPVVFACKRAFDHFVSKENGERRSSLVSRVEQFDTAQALFSCPTSQFSRMTKKSLPLPRVERLTLHAGTNLLIGVHRPLVFVFVYIVQLADQYTLGEMIIYNLGARNETLMTQRFVTRFFHSVLLDISDSVRRHHSDKPQSPLSEYHIAILFKRAALILTVSSDGMPTNKAVAIL